MSKVGDLLGKLIIKNLTGISKELVENAKSNASWSSTIPNAISFDGVSSSGDGRYDATIIVDLNKAPSAAAFEFGSGKHGEKGQRYRIPGEGKIGVAFPLSRWPSYKPPPDKEYFYFPFVMHPGVKAKPFLEPAIKDAKSKLSVRILEGLSFADFGIDIEVIEINLEF